MGEYCPEFPAASALSTTLHEDLPLAPGLNPTTAQAFDENGTEVGRIIFNIFRQKPSHALFDKAKEKGVGLIVRLPLASGLLSGKFSPDSTFAANDPFGIGVMRPRTLLQWLDRLCERQIGAVVQSGRIDSSTGRARQHHFGDPALDARCCFDHGGGARHVAQDERVVGRRYPSGSARGE